MGTSYINVKKPKIIVRKLGRERVKGAAIIGQADADGLVELDPRQTSKEFLDTLIHEFFHVYLPDASEEQVIKMASYLTEAIWKHGYRRTIK